ncbi:MAG TPA: T9SS type A sorting domain-containing protein [Pelobium sp.]|nr:T9SS type A sorting domain-containing protein [Pelobium sp.]
MKKIYFLGLGLTFLGLNSFAQDPTTAIVPTNSASDVTNVFSETYTPNSRFSSKAVNGSRASATDVYVGSNAILKMTYTTISDPNYSQSEWATNLVDASSKDYFHIDIYNPAAGGTTSSNIPLKLVDFGADGKNGSGFNTDNKEGTVFLTPPAPGTWRSYNIMMSDFGTNLNSQRNNLGAMLVTASSGSTLYFDNIYFSSSSTYNTLPLTLTSFTSKIGNNGADLTWTTASEENFNGFEVQRRSDNSEFSKTGFVAGGKSNYTFTDLSPINGNNYYRLKMIDNDGTFKYSDVKVVRYGLNDTKVDVSVYPNPVSDFTNISFNVAVSGESSISLSNIQGRVVKNVNSNVLAGTNTIKLNLSDIASGTYILTVSQNGKIIGTKKLVK